MRRGKKTRTTPSKLNEVASSEDDQKRVGVCVKGGILWRRKSFFVCQPLESVFFGFHSDWWM